MRYKSGRGAENVREFEKDEHAINVRVQGQVTFNSSRPMLRAAILVLASLLLLRTR
jgi:hypothetical protein